METLPICATVLASNAVSRVQAAVMTDGEKSFWGVQYHPEMDFNITAALLVARAERYIGDGFARDEVDIAKIAMDYRALGANPTRRDLAWRYGVTENILNPELQRIEFANWLRIKIAPRAQGS